MNGDNADKVLMYLTIAFSDHQTGLPLLVLTFIDESRDEFVIWSYEHDG